MAETAAEARIRDLKRRLEIEPGSRLFVALAEEYRKTGRLADALSTLQKGLLAHPNYLSAQVALGRAYLEAGQITEAIATFSRVLAADPGNLVSAKSLADIYLSRGESVEAIKKYKLYRALSGDRSVDEIIERLEVELAPPPPSPPTEDMAPPPPPTFYDDKPLSASRSGSLARSRESSSRRPAADLDVTSVRFELDDSSPAARRDESPVPLSRDLQLLPAPVRRVAPPPSEPEAVTRVIPPEDIAAAVKAIPPAPSVERPSPPPLGKEDVEAALPQVAAAASEPQGRVLADLYFAQGHYAEALAIYDDLVASQPHDEELRRLRRDAEARLLPAAATAPAAAAPDPVLERRLAKIRALKRWLAVVQTS